MSVRKNKNNHFIELTRYEAQRTTSSTFGRFDVAYYHRQIHIRPEDIHWIKDNLTTVKLGESGKTITPKTEISVRNFNYNLMVKESRLEVIALIKEFDNGY